MSDIASLLDRTTPADVAPLDLPDLARRSRRRRARRREAFASTALVAAAFAVGVAAVALAGAGSREADMATTVLGPDGQPVGEPAGSWTRAEDPPFAPRVGAFAGALPDGRVVVWGGNDNVDERVTGFADGGVLDPVTGTWEEIPAGPVTSRADGLGVATVHLVGGRLAVVGTDDGGNIRAAVYDVATGRWDGSPVAPGVTLAFDAAAWNGETLALVRTDPGGVGWSGRPGVDWRIAAPVTLRWRPGDPAWTAGAAPPLGLREYAGAGFDGGRLALWGGTDGTGMRADGAVYDVGADTWAAIPPGPLAGRVHATVAWSEGRLVVGGGLDTLVDAGEYLGDVAAWDPGTAAWEALAGPPAGGLGGPDTARRFVAGETPPLTAEFRDSSGDPEPGWYLGPGGWEPTPYRALTEVGGLVASHLGDGNYGDVPFALQLRGSPGEWIDAAETPFVNRLGAAMAGTPQGHLVVVGGSQGRHLDLQGDAWVFDLTG